MLLDALVLGETVRDAVTAGASESRVARMRHFSTTEALDGGQAYWTFALRDDRLVSVDLYLGGVFAALVPVYDAIARTLRSRHGAPTSAPPDEDDARHIALLAEGLPCDRYTRLRTLEWTGDVDRVSLSLYLTWPANIELRLRAERR